MKRRLVTGALLVLLAVVGSAVFVLGGSWAAATHVRSVRATTRSGGTAATAQAAYLRSVSCVRRTWCVAVGNTGDPYSGIPDPLAELWNGSSWTEMPSVAPPGANGEILLGVSCVTTRFCAAVGGGDDSSLFEMWDGTTWRTVGSGEVELSGVACRTTHFCVAVSESEASGGQSPSGLSEVWNGKGWRLVKTVRPPDARWSYLTGVSCPSRSFCLAVGQFQKNNNQYRTLVERFRAGSWKLLPSPNLHHGGNYKDDHLQGVSCGSPRYCLAVGYYDAGGLRKNITAPHLLALFYVRGRFTLAKPPIPWGATSSFLDAVGGDCAVYCMAGGEFFTGHDYSYALGVSWNARTRRFTLRRPGHFQGQAQANFAGISCENSIACMAVGWYSTEHTLFPTQAGTLAASWNGVRWDLRPTP